MYTGKQGSTSVLIYVSTCVRIYSISIANHRQ